jgi:uncharacterized RDD family membrane protein YckC
LQYGTPGGRLLAFGWDYLLIAGYVILLSVASSLVWRAIGPASPTVSGSTASLFDLLAFVTLVLPVMLYFAVSEASPWQATWGKRRADLRVISSTGGRLTIGRSMLRSALKFLPWQMAHTCLFHVPGWPLAPVAPPMWVTAGFVLCFVLVGVYLSGLFLAPAHRTLYDRAAGSHVVLAAAHAADSLAPHAIAGRDGRSRRSAPK